MHKYVHKSVRMYKRLILSAGLVVAAQTGFGKRICHTHSNQNVTHQPSAQRAGEGGEARCSTATQSNMRVTQAQS